MAHVNEATCEAKSSRPPPKPALSEVIGTRKKRKASFKTNATRSKKMQYRHLRHLKFTHKESKKELKGRSAKHRSYNADDAKRGLSEMIRGLSARKAERHTATYGNKVPRSTLKDLWLKFFKCPANAKFKFGVKQQEQMLQKLKDEFDLPSQGRRKYFLPDEEEMIMQTIELAHARGFPYDVDNLLALATTML